MSTNVIDHSASELRLHRVLYFVKYLRAAILNVFLSLAAVFLFVSTGISGLYPLADTTITGLRAQMNQPGPFGGLFPVVVGTLTGVILIFFFSWVYLSITRVRRVALKLQAAFLGLSVLFAPVWMWPALTFSIRNLSPLFSFLTAIGDVLTIAVGIDIAIAVWNVSRSPDTASFVATLDPRLAPGWWTYLNKLLDLPRTPFRSWRTAVAYLLSFSGTVLLIASTFYLLSVGGVFNEASRFSLQCGQASMAACKMQSSDVAWRVLLLLGVSVVGLQAASLLQASAKRLGSLSVSDVLRDGDDQFVLYLRPFDTDDVVVPKPPLPFWSTLLSFRPFPMRIEEEFFDVTDGYRSLIAIGNPRKAGSDVGGLAYRARLDDEHWQEYVLDKIRRADAVVMVVRDSPGVRWELTTIISNGATGKTLFLFDPSARDPEVWRSLAAIIGASFKAAQLVPPDFAFQSEPIAFHFERNQLVEIVNRCWTATSYRTAYSYFLAVQQSNAPTSAIAALS